MRVHSVREMAAAVRGRRQDLHLTQTEVAERAHVSRQWISAFEGGKSSAEFGLVVRVLETLGLTLDAVETTERLDSGRLSLDELIDEHRNR